LQYESRDLVTGWLKDNANANLPASVTRNTTQGQGRWLARWRQPRLAFVGVVGWSLSCCVSVAFYLF
jgi:hypothetical protein